MKVFLCGGGSGTQTLKANQRLNELIDHSKPCLYIPLAMDKQRYGGCYEWINDELKNVHIPHIDMIRSKDELASKNLLDYSFLYIGGGNTFKLLKELKASRAFEKISEYLHNDGIIFGGSAGAIIFGKDLEACRLDDANEVNLKEIDGFDILNGVSLLCHYTNRSAEKDEQSRKYLLELSKSGKILALPEEVTLFVNDNKVEVLGGHPYYYFEAGCMKRIEKEQNIG